MGEYEDIICKLSNEEIHVMEVLGNLHVSPNKNIDIHTLKKRLHGKYEKNVDKIFQKLKNFGLVGDYRSGNICMSRDGMIVARMLKDRKLKKLHPDFKHLLIF